MRVFIQLYDRWRVGLDYPADAGPEHRAGTPHHVCSLDSRHAYGSAARWWMDFACANDILSTDELKHPQRPCALRGELNARSEEGK